MRRRSIDRPWRRRDPEPDIDPAALPDRDPLECLQRLLASPALASKRWIWEQYDHLVMANTVQRPGGDAAVVRISAAGKALALATDCTPRYCRADPVRGGAQAVAESWRNLTAVGAEPLALTDNMNFGNPERPEIMGQLVGAIEGMREACLALDYPVVSGNVSLYNETSGQAILPTPVIGGVGLVADARNAIDLALKRGGDALILIGETMGHLGCSLYLREIEGREAGRRRRSISPPSGATAILSVSEIAAAVLPPAMICRMAVLLPRSPKWRLPAGVASHSSRCLGPAACMPISSARTRHAIWSRPNIPDACSRRPRSRSPGGRASAWSAGPR